MTRPTGRVRILGAGKAGTTVALGLVRAKTPVHLIARRAARAEAIARWCGAAQGTLSGLEITSGDPGDVSTDGAALGADTLTIIATPDAAVADVAGRLGPGGGGVRLHLSGLLDSWLLDAGPSPAGPSSAGPSFAGPSGAGLPDGSASEAARPAGGAMHPLAALPDPILVAPAGDVAAAIEPLVGALFVVDGSPRAVEAAQRVALALGGRPVRAALKDRAAYHAAAAIVANDLVALLSWGERLAVAAGLDPADARAGLVHLAGTALRSVRRGLDAGGGLAGGLTGAVGRGDDATLAGHLAAATRAGEPSARAGHALLSAELVDLLEAAGRLDAEAAARLRSALGDD
jgi:predicted short-subunit dehydrogenase-like oxidoreductase (DUF2520 family)